MGYVRFLLASSVLLVHFNAPVALSGFGGANSVEAFYFISGFLIATILTKKYSRYRDFYINRFLRIFPMYWIVLVSSFLLVIFFSRKNVFYTNASHVNLDLIQTAFLSLSNVFILGSDLLVFLNVDSVGNIGFVGFKNSQVTETGFLLVSPIWSVSLELFFYLIAPLIMKRSNRIIILITLSLLFVRFASYLSGINDDPWTYRFFPFELPIFLLGVIVFRFSDSIQRRFRENKIIKFIVHPLFFTFTFFAFGFYRSQVSSPRPLELFALLLLVGFVLIFSNNNEWSNSIGRFSYPIYIVHYPVAFFLSNYHDLFFSYFGNSTFFWILFQIIVVLVFSYSLILLTKPIDNIRDKLRSKSAIDGLN